MKSPVSNKIVLTSKLGDKKGTLKLGMLFIQIIQKCRPDMVNVILVRPSFGCMFPDSFGSFVAPLILPT